MKEFYLVDIDCAMHTRAIVTKRWWHSFIGMPFLTIDICSASSKASAEGVFTARHGHSHVIV